MAVPLTWPSPSTNQPALMATTSSTDPTPNCTIPNGTASATASGGTAGYSYAWTKMSDGSAAGNGSFVFGLLCGYYSVTITDANGCILTVDSVTVGDPSQFDGIEDELSAGISTWNLFPNPTENQVNLEIELATVDQVNFQIIDLKGRTILNRSFGYGLYIRESLNLDQVPAGIYLVKLSTSQGSASRKLVVK